MFSVLTYWHISMIRFHRFLQAAYKFLRFKYYVPLIIYLNYFYISYYFLDLPIASAATIAFATFSGVMYTAS